MSTLNARPLSRVRTSWLPDSRPIDTDTKFISLSIRAMSSVIRVAEEAQEKRKPCLGSPSRSTSS